MGICWLWRVILNDETTLNPRYLGKGQVLEDVLMLVLFVIYVAGGFVLLHVITKQGQALKVQAPSEYRLLAVWTSNLLCAIIICT